MSVKTKIDIEFKRTMEQADELDELSGLLCSVGSSGMDEVLTLLNRSYKGLNASEYINRLGHFKNRIYGYAEVLKGTAALMRMTARLIYEAEMAAIGLAGARM